MLRTAILRNPIIRYLPGILLTLAISYFAVTWLWKRKFVFGNIVGPYWLFITIDHTILPLTIVSFLGFVVTAWLARSGRQASTAARPKVGKHWVLLLASLIFIGTWPTMILSINSMDSLTVKGQIYRLATVPGFLSASYILFKCDRVGLMCWNIYDISGDFDVYFMQGNLVYEPEANTLSIEFDTFSLEDVYHP